MDSLQRLGIDEQLFLTSAGGRDIHGWPEAHLGAFTVEYQFHVTRAFELLEDHVIHPATRFNQYGSDNRQGTGFFSLARRREKLTRFLQCPDIETSGAGASAVAGSIVSAGQSRDRVHEQHDVATDFNEPLGAL